MSNSESLVFYPGDLPAVKVELRFSKFVHYFGSPCNMDFLKPGLHIIATIDDTTKEGLTIFSEPLP